MFYVISSLCSSSICACWPLATSIDSVTNVRIPTAQLSVDIQCSNNDNRVKVLDWLKLTQVRSTTAIRMRIPVSIIRIRCWGHSRRSIIWATIALHRGIGWDSRGNSLVRIWLYTEPVRSPKWWNIVLIHSCLSTVASLWGSSRISFRNEASSRTYPSQWE